ncbi:MAG TPA: hypothetical protein VMR34_00925 [Candidatus Saccharimonadales bacterium]|nr:hypothetical protein [Candidatus Saccharimonadales bacterium]
MKKVIFYGKTIYNDFFQVKAVMKNQLLESYRRDIIAYEAWDKLSEEQQLKAKLYGQVLNYLLVENELNTDKFPIDQIQKESDRYMKNKTFRELVLDSAVSQLQASLAFLGTKKYKGSAEEIRIAEILNRYPPAPILTLEEYKQHVDQIIGDSSLKLTKPKQVGD